MRKLANFLAIVSAVLSALLFVKNRAPRGFALWFPKLFAGAVAPVNAMVGGIASFLGLYTRSPLAAILGGLSSAASLRYTRQVTKPHDQFERAFGSGWEEKIPVRRRLRMLNRRWYWRMPFSPRAVVERDRILLPYRTRPG